ncbi:MAG: FeoA family protein [Thermoleophilia bacterium]
MMPIGLLTTGEKGEVLDFGRANLRCSSGREKGMDDACAKLEDMGLRVGQTVEMLNNNGKGPILLKVDNSRIAIDRDMAMKILVSI